MSFALIKLPNGKAPRSFYNNAPMFLLTRHDVVPPDGFVGDNRLVTAAGMVLSA
jgi:hypothetical protein